MSHYNAEIAKAAKECREHRQAVEDAGGIDPLVCPIDPLISIDSVSKPLKDIEGKAAGARYCYLADIANCVLGSKSGSKGYRDTMNNVGETLSLIVDTYDRGEIEGAMHYCSLLIENLLDVDVGLHHELVKVRANALDSGKYSPNGYKEKIDINLLLDAAARHFIKILLEADIDEESGCTHEAHIAANVIMIHTQLSKYGE
jgi:hypothetical protein